MHFVELKLCEKVGNVLEECNNMYQDSLQLLLIWMDSEIFERIIDGDVALCSQAKSYIVRAFVNENKSRLELMQSKKGNAKRSHVLDWLFDYVLVF